MKACCFPHQELTPEPSQENEPDTEDGSDSPTSHLNEANPMAKDVAVQLCDAAFVIVGKELKAHTQVNPAMARVLPFPEHTSVPLGNLTADLPDAWQMDDLDDAFTFLGDNLQAGKVSRPCTSFSLIVLSPACRFSL